jgi:hypothetical protein
MAERGVDIAGQRPKGLQEFMGKARFEFLITVCDRAEKDCPMFPGPGTREFWLLEDPGTTEGSAEERLERFRQARRDRGTRPALPGGAPLHDRRGTRPRGHLRLTGRRRRVGTGDWCSKVQRP